MDRTTLAGRGRRRRKLAAAALAVGAIAAAMPLLSTAGAAPPLAPSSDINDYALFAKVQLKLKGGDTAGRSVINGNIGVGTASEWNPKSPFHYNGAEDYRLQLCGGQSNKHTTFGPDNCIAPPSIVIGPGECTMKAAFGYALKGIPAGVYAPKMCGTGIAPPCVAQPNIMFPALPSTAPGSNGTTTVSLSSACANATQKSAVLTGALPPNNVYAGTASSQKQTFQGTVTLGSGTYTFCNVFVDVNAKVLTQPDTVINIVKGISSEGGQFGSNPNTRVNLLWSGDGGLGRRGNPVYYGTYNAPGVDLNLGHSSTINGRVWANTMSSDTGVNVIA